jgi:hypothetical protein
VWGVVLWPHTIGGSVVRKLKEPCSDERIYEVIAQYT